MSKLHPVPPTFAAAEQIQPDEYRRQYAASVRDPDTFWAEAAKRLEWIRFPTTIKDVSFAPEDVHIRWYPDGVLNPTVSCLDRHLEERGAKTAILFEGDDPTVSRRISYRELHDDVCRLANALKNLGIEKGDRIAIYMPMIPEAAVAMLASARIGAVHSVVFGGFSPDALAGRIADSACKLVITADEGVRAGKKIPLKQNVDAALAQPGAASVETVVVAPDRGRGQHAVPPRPLVGDPGGGPANRVRARTHECRRSAVHPVYLRQHRHAQRRASHHRWLHGVGLAHPSSELRLA
jgi:acetyl-CoA synthetase